MATNVDNVSAVSLTNNNHMIAEQLKPVFRNVVISLENCILSEDKLTVTPSMTDGLDATQETDLRILGCELIHTSGILLRLPQVAMATGQVLFQRYYYCKSFVRFPMEITAMACVTLASKVEEAPRRVRDVINVFHHMKQIRQESEPKSLVLDETYISTKNQVIKAERRLLKELGFCVHVKHPHKFIVTLLQVLENEKNQLLMQTSWNYMNDSLRTNVFVRYSPETIACACIYLSARTLKVSLPNNPNWFEVFNVSEDQIKDICKTILKLYTRPKPNQQHLESIVDNLRKNYESAKFKAKELIVTENGTPNSNGLDISPGSRANSPQVIKPKPIEKNSPKTKLKSVTNVVSHTSPNKKEITNELPHNVDHRSGSKSRSISPINKDRNERERHKSPPKSYAYSRSRSRSRERSSHHKHKRITYSRSRSRSPHYSSHKHYNHNSKYHSYNSHKSRKRSKSPYDRRDDRNSYHSTSNKSRSRDSRDFYSYRKS
ncbi:cyclin-L2-like [Oppia nitens]|uniref:cyclin-L2-like n=1 Tax=Oppia nitens TaxID=1686743 RepID=UPI0023DC0595|nr:cyclin-L2-like [Oppia nitens]